MENYQQHFLYPSTIYASSEPSSVTTILGSCVAVCLFDTTLKIGGINHYMLPLWNGEGLASPKYGNIAIDKLFERMYLLGSKNGNLIAKVFGGGEVIDTSIKQFNIGERNIAIAFEMLERYKIHIISKSVGGRNGRKIQFYTNTGEVKHKLIERDLSFIK
jgi:chemotaxis protein CheD